ncbi:iron-containing alcohol dehydrogenase, partial [Pseudomonas sihuiensis]
LVEFGYADKVIQNLPQSVSYGLFYQVEPYPSVTTVQTCAQAMRDFKPDLIIDLGGGSAMDAAK